MNQKVQDDNPKSRSHLLIGFIGGLLFGAFAFIAEFYMVYVRLIPDFGLGYESELLLIIGGILVLISIVILNCYVKQVPGNKSGVIVLSVLGEIIGIPLGFLIFMML